MLDSISKEVKDLYKEKESDSTWFKIFQFFEKLCKTVDNREGVISTAPIVNDLLIRSLQSERSRLNGIALDFLKKCADIAQKEYCFNHFLPILLKLTGKSNKVFVSRAMNTLESICKHVDLKYILKVIPEFSESANKNVRAAVFKVIEMRISDSSDSFKDLVEKGMRDPAQEVRFICKNLCVKKVEVVEKPVKKMPITSLTPRKNVKVDPACSEIKKLEEEVKQIAKEQILKRPINTDFFEKLNKLKQEHKFVLERKEDELTPRKLDKYLEKYRTKSPNDVNYTSTEILYNSTSNHSNKNTNNDIVNQNCHPEKRHLETIEEKTVETKIDSINKIENGEVKNISLIIDSHVVNVQVDVVESTVVENKDEINCEDLISLEQKSKSLIGNDIETGDNLLERKENDSVSIRKDVNIDEDLLITREKISDSNLLVEKEDLGEISQVHLIKEDNNIDICEQEKVIEDCCQNGSIIHQFMSENISFMIPVSDQSLEEDIKIIEEYENDVNDFSMINASHISDLSKSFANISIEPSRIDSLHINETGKCPHIVLGQDKIDEAQTNELMPDNIDEAARFLQENRPCEEIPVKNREEDNQPVLDYLTEIIADYDTSASQNKKDNNNVLQDDAIPINQQIVVEYPDDLSEKIQAIDEACPEKEFIKENDESIISIKTKRNSISSIEIEKTSNNSLTSKDAFCETENAVYKPEENTGSNELVQIILSKESIKSNELVQTEIKEKVSPDSNEELESQICQENIEIIRSEHSSANNEIEILEQIQSSFTLQKPYSQKSFEIKEKLKDQDLEVFSHSELNVFQSIREMNDTVISFIKKPDEQDLNDCNDTYCIKDPNETIFIYSALEPEEPSDIFQPGNSTKLSCVGLFNEQIFCSDEDSFIRKTPILKEKPEFSIEISIDQSKIKAPENQSDSNLKND